MIRFYAWPTPNSRKVSILLEELGLPYDTISVDIGKDQQFASEFLAISPNNKIPAIHDLHTDQRIFESAAIMIYLADRHGRFLPSDDPARSDVLQWLMWQMGGLGPIAGQAHHYLKFNPGASDYAAERLSKELARLYGVLDRQLAGNDFVAGAYSIADMAIWPWVSRHEWHQVDLGDYPNVRRWYQAIAERPQVFRGYHVPHDAGAIPVG